MFRKLTCEQNHKAPGLYTNNCYTNVVKYIKMTPKLKQRAVRKQRKKILVFQENRYKMQTFINPFEQNNNQTRIIHEI